MKHFKSALGMCFPHKVWVKEWQNYHNKSNNHVLCKKKYVIEHISTTDAYIYDDPSLHLSIASKSPRTDALVVHKWDAFHVCVDGGLIRYGCRSYMPDFGFPQGRCDSLVFDSKDLWFVELKMNATSVLDTQKWANLSDGMGQLKDFILNLRSKMAAKRTPLHHFYSVVNQHCTVSMRSYPTMNVSRNNTLERFRIESGIRLQLLNVIP